MKKLSLIAALALGSLLVCSTVAKAQDTNPAPKKSGKRGFSVEQRMERLSTELDLTDAQKPKVKAVLEDSMKQFQGVRDLPQDERRSKIQSIREEENTKMKEILTPDQMEKYTKLQESMKKRGKKKADQ
jgi:periplasmic protein CpxP/Spy